MCINLFRQDVPGLNLSQWNLTMANILDILQEEKLDMEDNSRYWDCHSLTKPDKSCVLQGFNWLEIGSPNYTKEHVQTLIWLSEIQTPHIYLNCDLTQPELLHLKLTTVWIVNSLNYLDC